MGCTTLPASSRSTFLVRLCISVLSWLFSLFAARKDCIRREQTSAITFTVSRRSSKLAFSRLV